MQPISCFRTVAGFCLVVIFAGLAWAAPATQPAGMRPIVRVPASQPSAARPGARVAPKAAAAQASATTTPSVGWIKLSGELHDGPPPVAFLGTTDNKPSLRKLIGQLHYAADHKEVKGLVIYLDQPDLAGSQVQEISAAIADVRAKKKPVLVFAEAYDLKSYLLACAADQILLQRKGVLELESLEVEEIYLAGLLEKLGMKADFLQVGKFKGAEEPLTRKGPSPEWSENFDHLLDDLWEQALSRIGAARDLKREQVLKAFSDCWALSDEELVKRGLVDRLVDRDLTDVTETMFGEDFEWDEDLGAPDSTPSLDNPFALLRMLFQQDQSPQVRRPSLAVIRATGVINSGDSASSRGRSSLFGSDSIGSRTLVKALGDAADNDMIKGVIIRIDSPGGSALASEVIWQAVRELGKTKPVYISIGSMAASGGYYMACAGDEIYADDDSIVGSIGVVGGKIVLGGLYDKIGLSVYRRSRGPMGDMFNSVEPFTKDQKAALEKAFQRTYDQFKDRVMTGRGKRLKDFDGVAQGRIFSGRQALDNGLVDKIGGVDTAVRDLARKVKLTPGNYDLVDLPAPMSLPEYLSQMFDIGSTYGGPAALAGMAASPEQAGILAAARKLMGRRTWQQACGVLDGMSLMSDEHVLTLTPTVIVVK